MVQRRAARFTTNRYHNTSCVSDMLHNLHWETLETRHKKLQLTMLYKIIHQLVEIDPGPFLTPTKPRPMLPQYPIPIILNIHRCYEVQLLSSLYPAVEQPASICCWGSFFGILQEWAVWPIILRGLSCTVTKYHQLKGLSYVSRVLNLGTATEAGLVSPRWLKSDCVLFTFTSFFWTCYLQNMCPCLIFLSILFISLFVFFLAHR